MVSRLSAMTGSGAGVVTDALSRRNGARSPTERSESGLRALRNAVATWEDAASSAAARGAEDFLPLEEDFKEF